MESHKPVLLSRFTGKKSHTSRRSQKNIRNIMDHHGSCLLHGGKPIVCHVSTYFPIISPGLHQGGISLQTPSHGSQDFTTWDFEERARHVNRGQKEMWPWPVYGRIWQNHEMPWNASASTGFPLRNLQGQSLLRTWPIQNIMKSLKVWSVQLCTAGTSSLFAPFALGLKWRSATTHKQSKQIQSLVLQ